MKKINIYFYIACACLVCVVIMAFIIPPVALLFIILSAVFFWLSKDVVLSVVSKTKSFFEKIAGKVLPDKSNEHSNEPKPVAKVNGKKSGGAKDRIIQENEPEHEIEMLRDFALPELTRSQPKSADSQKAGPAQLAAQSLFDEIEAEVFDGKIKSEDIELDMFDEKVKSENLELEMFDEKLDAENFVSDASKKKSKSKNSKPEAFDKKAEPRHSKHVPPNKEFKPNEASKAESTVNKQSKVDSEKSAKMSVSRVASKISAAPGQLLDLINFRDPDESPKEVIEDEPYRETVPGVVSGAVDGAEKQFDNLDMMTASAISIMLCETKHRAASPYLKGVKKPDVRAVLLRFCNDTYFANDIRQIDKIFSKSYYKRKVGRYFGSLKRAIRRGISDSFQVRVSVTRARKQRNTFINKICETINNFESVKYIPALSGNEEISDSKRNYKLDHLNPNYKDGLIYMVDLLLTCTCISKMLFVERKINEMDENSEFYTIIGNMVRSLDNHNMIINKSRPLYKQYYQSELGYIHGDDLLYGLAITIMVNRIKKNFSVNGASAPDVSKPVDFHRFKSEMSAWLDALARNGNVVDDVGTLILRRITTTIKDDYALLITAFQGLVFWENHYYQQVAYYKKEEDRRRYLSGNFTE